ncbi:hypothetical protein [Mycetocola saprophilus]|uniref:hypothetical protein n=1 Tax=Mycetocola saprophilus TaxID=76636 RepID=UPI003BF01413
MTLAQPDAHHNTRHRAQPRFRGRRALALGLLGVLLTGAGAALIPAQPAQAATRTGDDGLVLTVSPERVNQGDPDGFELGIVDGNLSKTPFDTYKISGLPAGWTLRTLAGDTLEPVSPSPQIFEVNRDVTGLRVVPPADFSGTLPNVQLARISQAHNLVTDFDNGTFDYLGQAKPRLDSASTPYTFHDPHTLTGQPYVVQYSPVDGEYSIWPTGMINGPDITPTPEWKQTRAYNNYWADLRSTTNAMVTPSTQEITRNWNKSWLMPNTRAVTDEESARSGKFLIINGSESLGKPHDVLTTTITGLTPHTEYTMSGFVANLSDDPRPGNVVAPVQVGFVVNDTFIGSSRNMPRQSGPTTDDAKWTRLTSTVNTGDSTSLTIGVRNFKDGGHGNDFGIDELSLFPMASVRTDLEVVPRPEPTATPTPTPTPSVPPTTPPTTTPTPTPTPSVPPSVPPTTPPTDPSTGITPPGPDAQTPPSTARLSTTGTDLVLGIALGLAALLLAVGGGIVFLARRRATPPLD